MGLDSDDERAAGEVGQVGVAIDSLADMETVFDGIPLDRVSTSMTINAPAPVLVAMYVAVADKQGVPREKVSGTAQNDVLKEYVARGTFIYPPKPSLRLAADLIAWCANDAPRFNAISLSGYHMREAGSTAVQEIAFTFANAIAYIDAVTERGVDVDTFAPRLSWIFNTHINFFEEIAKYRALRRLWARIMKERFGATDPRSMMLRTHTQTGGSTLTAQQPENNIVRPAIQALAAALGGVQSMALSCYDEALAIPTEKAQKIAVRTQQIIAEEIGVTDTIDPMAGSYYIEWLTDELERRAERGDGEDRGDRRRRRGDRVRLLPQGDPRRGLPVGAGGRHRRARRRRRQQVPRRRRARARVLQGRPDAGRRAAREARAAARRARLGGGRAALARLREAAEGEENLMPAIIEAVHAYCTLGEICGAMRAVFGEYKALAAI